MARGKAPSRRRKPPEEEKSTAPERIARAMDVPQNVFGSFSQICLSGNREVVLDGCKGVLEYEPELIRLSLGDKVLQFTGRNLQIKCMTGENVILEGYIISVTFQA